MNPRPLGYEPNELPDCSTPRQISISNLKSQIRDLKLVGLGRVELPTSRLSGVRSNQLSYRPKILSREPAHSHIYLRILPQKRATLLFSAVRFNGGRARGPCSFGGYLLPAIYFSANYERTELPASEISDFKFEI